MPTITNVIDTDFSRVNRRVLDEVAAAYRAACVDVSHPDKLRQFFETHYHPRAHFKDPLFEGHGYAGVLKYSHLLARAVEELRVEQWETLAEDSRIAIHWIIAVKLRRWPFAIRIDGVTLLGFDKKGRCVEHMEYWDLLNALLNMVPVIPRLAGLAPRRLREHLVFLRWSGASGRR